MKLLYYRHNQKEFMPTMNKHRISCHELTLVLDGSMQYTVNGLTHTLASGDIVYVPKGSTRSRLAVENTEYISINFGAEETVDFPVYIPSGVSDIIKLLIEAFDKLYQYTTNLNDERYCALLNCFFLQIKTQLALRQEDPIVSKIKIFIKNNISQKLTLSQIASHVYLSPVYCETVFKKYTGKCIIDYVIDERIKRAKNMLWDSGLSLKKISASVGFDDYNYFCRTFKKRTGIPPLQFRKNLQKL